MAVKEISTEESRSWAKVAWEWENAIDGRKMVRTSKKKKCG